MITQEQAERAIKLLKKVRGRCHTIDYWERWRDKRAALLDEIEASQPVTTASHTDTIEITTCWKIETNGDRIRAMTDEELAKKLAWHFKCSKCPLTMYCDSHSVKDCKEMFEEWLKKEEKEND